MKYFPNPLNITYFETIKSVEIYTIFGKKVIAKAFEEREVKIDLSNFISGTYAVRIVTENASPFIKVIKSKITSIKLKPVSIKETDFLLANT